jgi:RimJ/RimL family protein N-acetyltransferase
MNREHEIRTERLLLRRWRASDREPFARISSDPVVMEHLPGVMTREESDALADRVEAYWSDHGYGRWAIEVPGEADFAGFVGLSMPSFLPFEEIGWWLAPPFWGRGLATEAARAALADGFERAGLAEVISITIPANVRSRRVMERLGMTHDPADDFDHPRFPPGHRLSRHVMYRLSRKQWQEAKS